MPEVTLTFDNGPDEAATPLVLDVLRRRGIAASFFVVGSRLVDSARRALAERAHAEGHWIGNHSWSHSGPLGLRADRGHAEAEIGRTQALIGGLSHPDGLFRPVGGGGRLGPHLLSGEAVRHLADHAMTVALWSVVPGDWRDPEGWPDRAMNECLVQERPVVVLHDIAAAGMDRLEGFLGRLADAGARFRQDLPPALMPMRRGVATAALCAYVTFAGAPAD